MKAKPAIRSRPPRYPTRMEVLDDPDLLKRHMPPHWKACAEMAGAVSFLLLTNTGMRGGESPAPRASGKPAVVAPIFVHGQGRGVTGCVVVGPPVFLSEQDAMQVIREELGKAGVNLSQASVPLEGVSVPYLAEMWNAERGMVLQVFPEGKPTRLTLDAFDPQTKVGVEFVSDEKNERMAFTGGLIRNYDLKELAGFVNDSVRASGHDLYFGAFYDPACNGFSTRSTRAIEKRADALQRQRNFDAENAAFRELGDAVRAHSTRLLRMQVHDFINWLKGQGAI